MTEEQLIRQIKAIYGNSVEDLYTDAQLSAFLTLATNEIIRWKYHLVGIPESTPDTSEYDSIKVMAVIVGLTQSGAEGETVHMEGSFSRHFADDTMIQYIHRNVIPYVGTGR